MALARRGGTRFAGTIWPGFVDALTALLLILMFVLSIFMIVQFSLRERITGQDQELRSLGAQLAELSNQLAIETSRADDLSDELGSLGTLLDAEQNEKQRLDAALAAMTARFEDANAQSERLAAALAVAAEETDAAETRNALLEEALETEAGERQALAAALAASRSEVDRAAEEAALAAAQREALQALVEQMRAEAQALETANAEAEERATRIENERLAALARIEALEAETARADGVTAERDQALARIETLEDEKLQALDRLATLEEEKLAALERLATLEDDQLAALERAKAAESALTEEEEARLVEAAAARALRRRLEAQADELDAVTLALEETRKEAEQTLTLLAAAEAAKAELEQSLDDRAGTVDEEAALRRVAEATLAEAEEQTLAEQRKVALLNAQVSELRSRLGALQALLDDAETRDAEQKVQIEDLGQRLNRALAQKVSDLARFRSVFFERMEGVLGGREDIQRVGDRFVFQSEVLFDPGSAVLGPDGEAELAKLGEVLREVSSTMPDDLNWILRVDGHTDRRPLRGTGRYRNNWELSQARALSVVDYLVNEEGVPPERLAAAGFGEFQPIADGEDDVALARNRRIEFKFTER